MSDNNFEPFDYGRSLSIILSRDVYSNPKVAIREVLTNIYDQFLHEAAANSMHFNEAYVEINPIAKTIRIYDYATGIENVEEFKIIGSNRGGKVVGSRISTVKNPDEDVIGQFHIGKAAFPSLSNREIGRVVKFESNNGKEGIRLAMMIRKIEGGDDFEIGWDKQYSSRFPKELAHLARKEKEIGLSIEIEDVKKEFLKIETVKEIIAKQFGLLIRIKGFKIFIRDVTKTTTDQFEQILASQELETKGASILQVSEDSSHVLTHRFVPSEKPAFENIDLYIKWIYITSFRLPYKVKGWYNDNKTRLIANREKPRIDDIFDAAKDKLTSYIAANFEKEGKTNTVRIKGLNRLEKIVKNMLKIVQNDYATDPIVLSGVLDEVSNIKGQIETDPHKRGGWQRRNDMQLVSEGGDPNGEPIIPIGKGKKRKGGKRTTGSADSHLASGIEGGDHPALVGVSTNDRPKTGNIDPSFRIDPKDIGADKPLTYMERANLLYLNTDQPAINGILSMPKGMREAALSPLLAEAVAEFMVRFRHTPTNIDQYRAIVTEIYTKSMMIE